MLDLHLQERNIYLLKVHGKTVCLVKILWQQENCMSCQSSAARGKQFQALIITEHLRQLKLTFKVSLYELRINDPSSPMLHSMKSLTFLLERLLSSSDN